MNSLRILLFCIIALTTAPGQDELVSLTREEAVAWLRSLATEARVDLRTEEEPTVRLFNETLTDGRTWMTFIQDTLSGAPSTEWATIDEAVMTLLTEADYMKTLAAEQPIANTIRRQYLEAAATLLSTFKNASEGVFDDTIGQLDNPLGLPDWALPGDIEITEAAGSARINVATKEFGGRLSGEIALPKFDAKLVVPNASFDSRGNIDLSAYGQASLPPDSNEQVQLSILKRRPMSFQLTEDGQLRVGGSGRVRLPDGNTFEAFFDANDPEYEFGLAYSGNLTIDLAEEIKLTLPVINADASLAALGSFGEFFGAFGRGLEAFLEESPDFPSLDEIEVGTAPEFEVPVTTIPLDIVDAWAVSVINDHVRPAVNGSFDGSVKQIRELLAGWRREVLSAQAEIIPELNQVKRLRRSAASARQVAEAIKKSAEQANGAEESGEALAEAAALAEEHRALAEQYLENLPADSSLEQVSDATRYAIDASATSALLGNNGGISESLITSIETRFQSGREQQLQGFGLGPDGQVSNPEIFARTTTVDLLMLFKVDMDIEGSRALLGRNASFGLAGALSRHLFEREKAAYNKATTAMDLAGRAEHAVFLDKLGNVHTAIGFTANAQEIALMKGAINEVVETVIGDEPSPERNKLAAALIDAGQNHQTLLQDIASRRGGSVLGTNQKRKNLSTQAAETGTPFAVQEVVEEPFFETWFKAIQRADAAGEPGAAQSKASLRSVMSGYAEAQRDRYSDPTIVEQNLTSALETLKTLANMLAAADELLPADTELISELQTTWQALHIEWVAIAEAQKLHWYLSEYVSELAAISNRYADDLDTALESAFRVGAMAASDALVGIVTNLSNAVQFEQFRFALPGDLEVQRMFGSLRFNRITGAWDVEFGGRLFFDDYEFGLEVPGASIASNGDFTLNLLTDGPVPFGFEDSLRLDTAFDLSGNALAPSLNSVSAQGQLTQSLGDGTFESYNVSVGYAFRDPPGSHDFDIAASFDAPRELFTEEIVIFEGGFGFALSTDANGNPQQAGAEVAMTVGILKRDDAEGALTEDDFFLKFEGMASTNFSTVPGNRFVEISLNEGELFLPGDIFSESADPSRPAKAALLRPLCVRYDFETEALSFCDPDGNPAPGLRFANIVVDIPGLEGGRVAITEADLSFRPEHLIPVLENLNASITLPLPGQDARQSIEGTTVLISAGNWPITGLPEEVGIALESPLRLLSLDGLSVDVLANAGATFEDCPAGLSFVRDLQTNETTLRIASGMRVSIDPDMVSNADSNAALQASASGCFTWKIGDFPSFELGTVSFAGRFRLGGDQGVEIKGADPQPNAMLTFTNVQNLFERPPSNVADSFRIDVAGAVNFADFVEFGIFNSGFIWDGSQGDNNLIPRFEPGGFYAALGEDAIDLAGEYLPIYPTSLGLRFKDSTLPVVPSNGEIGLFDPTNIIVPVSGVVALPNGAALEGGSPGIFGSVDNLEIQFVQDPNSLLPIPDIPATLASLNGFCLQLQNLDIPPLGGITGGLCVGNLSALPDHPEDLLFAGQVGAKVNNVGASVLIAAKPLEFIGACFELNAGPAGIPLDGGTLGGILLTGGRGGINFKNSFSDPCDFQSYITLGSNSVDGNIPTEGSAERSAPNGGPADLDEIDYPDTPTVVTLDNEGLECVLPRSPDFNCITGPFPPPTINPLCKKITVNGEERVIFKGTDLSRTQVDDLLALANISPAELDALRPGEAIDLYVGQTVGLVETNVLRVLDGDFNLDGVQDFDPNLVDRRAMAFFEQKLREVFNSVDDAASSFLREVLHRALKVDPNVSIYQTLVAKAAEGIPCFDVTLKLEGTFSHAAISTVLSGTGGVTLSSTGTAVLEGRINLVGIPVGEGTLAFSLTNENGSIDPSFGGVVEVALGPLELGRMTMSLGCPGCFDAVIDALTAWVATNSNAFGSDVTVFLIRSMDGVAPRESPRLTNTPLVDHFLDLSEDEQFAWVSSFFNLFQVIVDNTAKVSRGEQPDALPVVVTTATLENFLNSFKPLLIDILLEVNPRICFGGEVGPKLFGFPLTGGADTVVGGGLLYQKVEDPITGESFQELVAQTQFSPSYMLLSAIMGGASYAAPAFDQTNLGYSVRMPAFTEENIGTLLMDPAQFAGDQITTLLEDAVLSFGYQFQPLGYQMANGQGRMIMPRIGGHPLNPNRDEAWVNPDDLEDPSIPTRMEVILAALTKGQMQNPLWRGTSSDLTALFNTDTESDCYIPTNSGCLAQTEAVGLRLQAHDPQLSTLSQLDFANDYFPHGGLIGGAEIAFPNLLSKAPPSPELAALFDLGDFQNWLSNVQTLFGDPAGDTQSPAFGYFTGTECTGQMAFYLPAPNPIGFDFLNGSSQGFVQQLQMGDFQALVDRTLPDELYPADEILFRGWMDAPVFGLPVAQGLVDYSRSKGCFVLSADVLGNIDGQGTPSWLHKLVGASVDFQIKAPEYLNNGPAEGGSSERLALLGSNLSGLTNITQAQNFVQEIQATMPKVSLETDASLQIPSELAQFITVSAGASAGFFAFSPAFQPDFETDDDSPYALARRRGGMGVRGSVQLGYFPPELSPEDHLIINVPDMSLSMFPDANFGVFPALAGQAVFDQIQVPGPLAFNASGLVQFNSSPDIGEDFIQVEGETSPIDLGAFLQVTPLNEGDDFIGASIQVTNTETGPALGLGILPARATIPMFGSLSGKIFGGDLDHETLDTGAIGQIAAELDDNQPFTFSTVPGQAWSAIVQLDGALDIRSPLDIDGPVLFSAQPVTQGNTQIPFLAQIEGVGADEFEIRLTIPNGLTFTLFPGTPHASTVTVGDNSATCLLVNSDGRVYFDSGTRSLDLAGLGEVEGRIELGFEPFPNAPTLGTSQISSFTASMGESTTRTLRITNRTSASPSQLVVDAALTDSTHFTVTPSRLTLGAEESADLTIRFTPRALTVPSTSLVLSSNAPQGELSIPLPTTVEAEPNIAVHATTIDFAATPLGQEKTHLLMVSNTGDATLLCTSITTSGAAFSDDRSALTVPPGESRAVAVSYIPTTTSGTSGTLRILSDDPDEGSVTVKLSGLGSDRFWLRQRKGTGTESLQGIAMRPSGRGFVGGLAGAFLRTDASGGRAWLSDPFLNHPDIVTTMAASETTLFVAGKTRPANGKTQGFVARSANGGASWTPLANSILNRSEVVWRDITAIPGSSFLALAGGDSHARLVIQTNTNDYEAGVAPNVPPLHALAFGTRTVGLAVGEKRTLLRTTDGGKTWQTLTSLPKEIPDSLNLLGVAANPFSTNNYIITGEDGLLLRTTNAGNTWSIMKTGTDANLHDVIRAGSSHFFAVGDSGTVLLGNSTGSSWTLEDAQTTEPFRSINTLDPYGTSVSPNVWAATYDGGVYFRSSTALSGPIAVIEADDMDNLRAAEGERVIREIRVANQGTEDLVFGLEGSASGPAGISVTPKGEQTIAPGEEVIFYVIIDAKSSGSSATTIGITSSDDEVGKSKFPVNVDVREPTFKKRGYLQTPAQVRFTLSGPGEARASVPLTNIGLTDVQLHHVDVRHANETVQFEARADLNEPLTANKDSKIELTVRADEAGQYRGFLEIASDAANGIAVVEVIVDVAERPDIVIVRTEPPGLPFQLDHDGNGSLSTYSDTTAFTVVDGLPDLRTQLRRGSNIRISASTTRTLSGQRWEFQRWLPGGARESTFQAGSSASQFTALYASTQAPGAAVNEPPLFVASPCAFEIPNDITGGPWVRITQARLNLPWLSDGSGSDFEVNGSLFLSLDRAYGSLRSSRVRVFAPSLNDLELLEITPSTWDFDIDSQGSFALSALTPGVQVLNASTLPPSELRIEVDLATANRRAFLHFGTLDELPLSPGVLALGPGTVEFETNVSLNEANLRFAVDGSLRALANPLDLDDWLIDRPYEFEVAASISPLTFNQRTTLASLGVVRLFADQGSVIRPVFNADSIGLEARNLDLEFFRSNSFLDTTASVNSAGEFTFNATLPSNGLDVGAANLKADSASNRSVTVLANPLQAQLAVEVPRLEINSTAALWPNDTLKTPGPLSFDTGDFTVRLPLPAIEFAGFGMDNASSQSADHYFEFARTPSTASVKLRNRMELFLGRLKFAFDINTSGTLSGTLAGEIGVAEPTPLNAFNQSLSLNYSSDSNPPFVANSYFFLSGLRFKVDTGFPIPAQACFLDSQDSKPIEDWPETLCFP